MARGVESAIYRPEQVTTKGVEGFFAEVLSSLDANPREIEVHLDFSESDMAGGLAIDLEKGEPVFRMDGSNAVHAKFRGRYLAEHAVPLKVPGKGMRFLFTPTDGNRIKVRRKTKWN